MRDRTWTMDELIDAYERVGAIQWPFTPDERALAQSVAAAFHFAFCMEELPGRCPDRTPAYDSLAWGIHQVNERRKGQAAGTTSHDTKQGKGGQHG